MQSILVVKVLLLRVYPSFLVLTFQNTYVRTYVCTYAKWTQQSKPMSMLERYIHSAYESLERNAY